MARPFTLTTERLSITMLGREHITEFTRYRNLDAIARYQDWPLPFTRDHAHRLVDQLEALSGPTAGGWVQLAIERDGELIGDLAVWLDDHESVAMVGYTLAPEHHGLGYASEALGALVDWLFHRRRVHRIAATIDPRNLASARVLEHCGFEYEGTARSAALVRGEWSDDARFSLLEPDWTTWRARPTDAPDEVRLTEVTPDNLRAVLRIDRSFSQRDLVAPVAASLAQALVPPVTHGETMVPWVRVIEADGELAGFVMLAEPTRREPHPYLWRLVIDRRYQRRGIGERALREIARLRHAAGATHLDVSYVPAVSGSPEPFYLRLGFVPTGRVEDGEVEARLDLSTVG